MTLKRENFEDQWIEHEYKRLCGESARLREDAEERLHMLEELYWKAMFSGAVIKENWPT